MRKNKFALARFVKMRSPLARLIGITIIIFLALFLVISYSWRVFSASGYFTIKDIISREANIADLSYLIGRNIFSIDLRRESEHISEFFPDYSKIKLFRVLPNRIFVDFIKRKPVAFVKLYRYFVLDKEGVLFYGSYQPPELELPVIVGLETKIFGPQAGKKYSVKELLLALDIIREVKRNRALKNYKIKKIDVLNPANAVIFISLLQKVPDNSGGQALAGFENLEVRIGQDNIKDRIVILAGLFTQAKKDLVNIKYIDLRFKDPVIKLK